MPSAKETRYWLILGLLILWGGVVALAWDVWQGWPPTPDVPLDVLLTQARTRVDHSPWYMLVALLYGVLLCTRVAWCVLRHDTDMDRAERMRTMAGGPVAGGSQDSGRNA
jgi:hypothetical protein